MLVVTYSAARQNFATVLDRAKEDGEVLVTRADGSEFVISPRKREGSPFDCVESKITLKSEDVAQALKDIREESEKTKISTI